MALVGARTAKRVAIESLGWLLVGGGVAALILPGPGLFMVVAGLALLSQQHEWAARRVEPLKRRALQTAAHGVATWPRIATSVTGAVVLVALGALWCVQPAAPGWWPAADRYWLVGGWGAGVSLVVSGLLALALVVYSCVQFRGSASPLVQSDSAAGNG